MGEHASDTLITRNREHRSKRRRRARWIEAGAIIAILGAMFIESDAVQLGLYLAAVIAMFSVVASSIRPDDAIAKQEFARNAAIGFGAQAVIVAAVAAYCQLADKPLSPWMPIAAVLLATVAVTGFSNRFDPE